MMTCALPFFGYMNFRGMDFASSIQLILAFALVAGVLILTVGSFSTSTASLDNLFPLFAEGRSPWACVIFHRGDHPLVVRRSSIPFPRPLKNSTFRLKSPAA